MVSLGRTQPLERKQRVVRSKLVVATVSALMGTRAMHLAHQAFDVMIEVMSM